MNLSWHDTDQVRLSSRLTYFYRAVMIFVRYLSEIRYFESRKPIIPTGFRYCVKLHFRHFRFRFLSGWNCFNGLVHNLNPECAWRQSYHSIKHIINPAFLSRRGHGRALRPGLKPGQLVQETNVQDIRHQYYTVQPYMDPIPFRMFAWLKLEPCHLSR